MQCFYPLQGWYSRFVNKSGKRSVVFNVNEALDSNREVVVSCGRCSGCRLRRSSQWAQRIVHEASLYENNCFITLTYNDRFLPNDGGLRVEHFQRFMKRLRKHNVTTLFKSLCERFPHIAKKRWRWYANRKVEKVRFFHCGEYGEKTSRPHYHAILFNFEFPDLLLHEVRNGHRMYTSEILDKLWGKGFCSVGSVTFDSAAYVARYIMKKHLGKDAWLYYSDFDMVTGEILVERKPDYVTMSRRPGIGKRWIYKYMESTYFTDSVVLGGSDGSLRKFTPAKYYDSQFEIVSPQGFEKVKLKRKLDALAVSEDNTSRRLKDKEVCLNSKLKLLVRHI